MGSEEVNPEKQEMEPTAAATVVTAQPSNVVLVQPVRALPGRWSVDELNVLCCIAMLVPCVDCAWAVSNGRKASFSILKNESI